MRRFGTRAVGPVVAFMMLVGFIMAPSAVAQSAASQTPTLDVEADSEAIAAVNASTLQVSSAINQTCATTTVANSTYLAKFQLDCASGKAEISNATAALNEAAALVAGVKSGQSANLAALANLLSRARASVGNASTQLVTISSFTYASRGEAFAKGPMASQIATANASVRSQGALDAGFKLDVSSFQAFSASQASTADGLDASASTVASSMSSVSMTALDASISSQQATLAAVSGNLTQLSGEIPGLLLPPLQASDLQGNVTATETSLNSYKSALLSTSASAGDYPRVTISGFSAYVGSFDSGTATSESDGSAFASSLASLQTQLATLAGEFPLVSSLAVWQNTFASLVTTVDAGNTRADASMQATAGALATANSDVVALTTRVQAAPQVEVNQTLLQNVSSVASSEAGFLNATALAEVRSASASLDSEAQLASSYAASSQSLLGLTVGNFESASQTLIAQGASLKSLGQSTSNAMTTASTFIDQDLTLRSQAFSSAESLISQAMGAFRAQQVPQGTSLLEQASLQLQAAYSVA